LRRIDHFLDLSELRRHLEPSTVTQVVRLSIRSCDACRCGGVFLLADYHFDSSFLVCGETLTRRTHVGCFNVPPAATPFGVLPPIGVRAGQESLGEVWTYNFGPSRLMQRIRFENGVVVKIESLGYGF
jgi:hypothetical protein